MNPDERVRQALHRHAERIEAEDGSWGRIQQRVEANRRRRRRGWAAGSMGAVAATVLLVVAVSSLGGGGQVVQTGPAAPPGTSAPSADRDAPPAWQPDMYVAGIWPFHTQAQLDRYRESGDVRYDDPAEVARAFAVEYLAMVDPVVGEPDGPHPGGDHTVIVQPRGEEGQPLPPGIMETVIYLDPAGGPPWQVLAATATNIRLDGGRYFRNAVSSPIAVSGQATAYEGTVQVEVRQAGMEAGEALGRDFVTAGALGTLSSFAAEIAFDRPADGGRGTLMLYTESAVDGSTLEATVTGLSFGGNAPTLAPTTTMIPGQTEVMVFFVRGNSSGEELVPVTRSVPTTAGVLRASLEQLLVGPTEEEQAGGLRSLLPTDAADELLDVMIDSDGKATANFGPSVGRGDFGTAGAILLLQQLKATVFQFPTVNSVEYQVEGSCLTFGRYLEAGQCIVSERGGG